MHNKQSHQSNTIIKYSRNLTFVLCMGMLAGVLIWAKLRLVTDIPRSAYADPREAQLLLGDDYENQDFEHQSNDQDSNITSDNPEIDSSEIYGPVFVCPEIDTLPSHQNHN